jgi:hypothetical protein
VVEPIAVPLARIVAVVDQRRALRVRALDPHFACRLLAGELGAEAHGMLLLINRLFDNVTTPHGVNTRVKLLIAVLAAAAPPTDEAR